MAGLCTAELLIQHVSDWDLIMTLPASMPTHEHHVTKKKSRLDNVFCTPHTTDLILQCEALLSEPKPGMDHFPIVDVSTPGREKRGEGEPQAASALSRELRGALYAKNCLQCTGPAK